MTPEKALGRLINLREQLLDEPDYSKDNNLVLYLTTSWSVIIDDLDDIIRSIKREVEGERIKEYPINPYDDPPDSEDTERRRKR